MLGRLSGWRRNPLRTSASSKCSKKRRSSALLAGRLWPVCRSSAGGAGFAVKHSKATDNPPRPPVQGREGGVERHRQDRIGERDVVVDEAGALGAEQDAAGFLGGDEAAHFLGGKARRHLALDHGAVARRRGIDV